MLQHIAIKVIMLKNQSDSHKMQRTNKILLRKEFLKQVFN